MPHVYTLKKGPDLQDQQPKFLIPYEEELNPSQLEAVTTLNGPVVCIAGAGSGKTRTLVFRVARLIESGVPPENILLLTFTRKAAHQMLTRASQLLGSSGSNVSGGTYHSFAAQVLRRHGQLIGLASGFSIIDESDASDIINLARTELGLNKRETRFPQKKTLKEIQSRALNHALSIDEVVEREYAHFFEHLEDIKKILQAYSDYKRANHLLDYDDLLTFLRRLLEESKEARERLSDRYRLIMIDEYQDTNLIQARITEVLGTKYRNVMVVGDDAQSVYSFRGARFRNIHDFPQAFPEARIIKLEQNYRSTQSILAATNHLMTHAAVKYEKKLFSKLHQGDKPALIGCADEDEQSQFVAQRILDLREEGVPLSKMAVLFRSGFHAFQLEIELRRRNIPFVKWGGFKFLEAAHVKDLVSHLRILYNPLDLVSWQRVLLLVEGIGSKSIPVLFEAVTHAPNPFDLEALKAPPRMKSGLARLGKVLQKAFSAMEKDPQTAVGIIADYYVPMVKATYDDYPKRLRDLDQIAIICGKYKNIQDLLSDFALEPPNNSIDGALAKENNDDEELLVISTIHSAKGLEWHSVFIIWALEGRFPAFSSFQNEELLEEERRLMYVAMTRARENLFITYPTRFWDPVSGQVLSRPSRFIEEIGPEFLESWQLRRET